MKKRLSIVLAIAMVFSMFSSLAFAAEQSSMDKFEALKSQGIFTGYPDGSAGLDKEMNRAEFAAVIARALGLEEAEGNSYSDVDANDIEKYDWAAGYIEAVTEAGILEGDGNGKFAPGRNVSVQELLVIVARILELDTSDETEVENAYDWAYGAINATNALNVLPEQEDYLAAASREQLVIATYAAVEELTSRAQQLSIADAKATDASEVTVSLNKASSKEDLVVTLKKGSITTSVDKTVWSEDNKTVTLTTNSKLTEGTYTVSIAAAADKEIEIGTDSKSFDVTNERVTKIEFVAASDEIAQFDKNIVQFQALNQYDKVSSFPASSFTITSSAGTGSIAQLSNDKQEFTFDTANYDSNNNPRIATGSKINVTIIAPNAEVTANKLFTVGSFPAAAKVEFGDIELAQDREIFIDGDAAVLPITVLDQYGNILRDQTIIDNSTTKISTRTDVINAVTVNADGNLDLTTTGTSIQDTDVTINIIAHANGNSFTQVVKVYAKKAPAEVSFVAKDEVIAVGDGPQLVELKVTDQFGKELSRDEIAQAVTDNKFTVYSTNSSVVSAPEIVETGADRGKLKFNVGNTRGNAEIKVMVNNGAKTFTHSVSVQEARTPHAVVVKTEASAKLLPGASSDVKFVVNDQYGKAIAATAANIADFTLEFDLGTNGHVTATPLADIVGVNIVGDKTVKVSHGGPTAKGKTDLTVKLVNTSGTNDVTVSNVKRTYEALEDNVASGLTYEITEVGTVFAHDEGLTTPTTPAYAAKEAKVVKVSAKDSSGNKVALPSDAIQSVVSSNPSLVQIISGTNSGEFAVYGKKKGTVTLTVAINPASGETQLVTQSVTSSADAVVADSIKVKVASADVDQADLNTSDILDLAEEITITSNYGTEYKGTQDDLSVFQLVYAVSKVKGSNNAAVSINNAGVITSSGTVDSFTVTILSGTSGKSATVEVKVN